MGCSSCAPHSGANQVNIYGGMGGNGGSYSGSYSGSCGSCSGGSDGGQHFARPDMRGGHCLGVDMSYSYSNPEPREYSGPHGHFVYDPAIPNPATPHHRRDRRDMHRAQRTPDEVREVRRLLYVLEHQQDRARERQIDELQFLDKTYSRRFRDW